MSDVPRDQVFISYSHKDKRWLDDLLTHLKPYLRDGSITYWSDRQIQPGSEWLSEIRSALIRTKVAVLLVTKDFLASDFIHEEELGPLLLEAKRGGVRILWIPVRASSYHKSPIKDYQAVIEPSDPLAQMRARRDAAWVQICKEIERAAGPSRPLAVGREKPVPHANSDALSMAEPPPWLPDLQHRIESGDLCDSAVAPVVLAVLRGATQVKLVAPPDWPTMLMGIAASDDVLRRVQRSAGIRDWQLDLPLILRPTLIAVAHALEQSSDAQELIVRLCNAIARRVPLSIDWPTAADEYNDLTTTIYRRCLEASTLECDDLLTELKRLVVVGPGLSAD